MYNSLTFFFFILAVTFLSVCSTPTDALYIFWSTEVCPRLNEYLGVDSLHFPSSSFLSPLVFFFIFSLLFFGFLPYSMEFLLNFWVVFFFSASFWFGSFIHMISVKRFSLYMVKKGHPRFLTFFLVMIELVSEFIKPFSLGVRLYANLLFGHYLLLIVWFLLSKLGFFSFIFSFPFVFFELSVFLVQSYIFAFLVSMYHAE